jgi:hypothetical protein
MKSTLACPARGRRLALALVGVTPFLAGASYQTRNFTVEAPTTEAAKKVGDHAEICRKSIALAWIGREMPAWSTRCPIRVVITAGEAGGETSFAFSNNRVADQKIRVEGRLDRILASSLPHEVTHTVFAAYFGGPMPRWADEGASLLSEDLRETQRHDQIVASLLTRRGDYALGRLFVIEEYPSDLMGFYGQGYSVSRFLVEMGGRPRFLKFVKDGMATGWDGASKTHYGLADCRELDRAWRSWHAVVASSRTGGEGALVVRAQSPASGGGR